MKAELDALGLEEKVVLLDLDPMFYRFAKVDLDQDPFSFGMWRMPRFLFKNQLIQTLWSILS